MKLSAVLLASGASASAISPLFARQNGTGGGCEAAVELDATTNIFTEYNLHANNFYASEIEAAIPDMSEDIAAQAAKVAEVGSFVWV